MGTVKLVSNELIWLQIALQTVQHGTGCSRNWLNISVASPKGAVGAYSGHEQTMLQPAEAHGQYTATILVHDEVTLRKGLGILQTPAEADLVHRPNLSKALVSGEFQFVQHSHNCLGC